MEFVPIDLLNGTAWSRLASDYPDFGVFHTAAWARVLVRTYDHQPNYLQCVEHGETIGFLPLMELRSPLAGRRGVALPFSDFCPPLVSCVLDEQLLMEKLRELAAQRRWQYFELRGESDHMRCEADPSISYYGHTLDLSRGPDRLFSEFSSSVRRAVRKAESSGVIVRIGRDREALLEYYRLHVLTRRRQGLPPQPVSFFLRIYEELISAGLGFVSLARVGGRLIAGAVFLHAGRRAVYKFGASDTRYQSFRGNNLVMWSAIKFLANEGLSSLHFGRTSLASESLRRYKLGWGAQEEIIRYFRFSMASGSWAQKRDRSTGFHSKIFSRLPLAVNRMIGGLLYPHLD